MTAPDKIKLQIENSRLLIARKRKILWKSHSKPTNNLKVKFWQNAKIMNIKGFLLLLGHKFRTLRKYYKLRIMSA